MEKIKKLTDCGKNQIVTINNISAKAENSALKRHLHRLGIVEGTRVFIRKTAAFGGPIEINVRGCEIAIRKRDADIIEVRASLT